MEYNINMKTNNERSFFSAVVDTVDYGEVAIDVELPKNECDLTYDEVYDAICNEVDEKYGYSDLDFEDGNMPYEIIDIVVNADDGESYPVISEDADDTELKKSKTFSKYLVLPWATYALTPEAQLWMNLKKNGIIDEDAEFDYEKYHKILESKE